MMKLWSELDVVIGNGRVMVEEVRKDLEHTIDFIKVSQQELELFYASWRLKERDQLT